MKSTVLYHASPNKNIKIFEPRAESVRDKNEGPVVFATPYKDYASCFIVNTNDTWTRISRWGIGSPPWNIIVSDKERFEKLDKGGAIYELSSESFHYDKNEGTKESEWVSKIPTKPVKKTIYKSGLKAMLENGVNVFFVSKEVFSNIVNSEDHGYAILLKLKPFSL